MDLIFDDTLIKKSLFPFTAVRNAADIRIGILTIREKWERMLADVVTAEDLTSLTLSADIVPSSNYARAVIEAGEDQFVFNNEDIRVLNHPWHIFQYNDWALRKDFELITQGRKSQPVNSTNRVTGIENIFLEAGASVEHCILNASDGPIYIGKNATIMEGSMIRGPFALCENAMVKMGTKIYGATTVGPYSVVGGEIKNSVIFGYSNKGHDGYLGDSVLGEWCNLGAGTSNSNLKNTAGEVRVWDYKSKSFISAGTKCGLLMGDYSRAAINTSFNTGTVVGICCNIFGEGYPEKWLPNFTWGKEKYLFNKAMTDIANWKKLKGHLLDQEEEELLKELYNQ